MAAKYPEDMEYGVTGEAGGSGGASPTCTQSPPKSPQPEEEVMNCSICCEPFENPKVLPCHHTFCTACLEKYFHSYQQDGTQPPGTFPCPVCRSVISVDAESGLEALTEGAPSEQIQELVAKISVHKKVNCDVCKYRQQEICAQDHCSICGINYCEHCSADHSDHSLFHTHTVIPVIQMDNTALKCDFHQAEHVKYFCNTCLAPLCTVCAVAEHRTHSMMDLQTALSSKKTAIQTKIESMSDMVCQQEELLSRLEDIHSVREAAVKKTRLEIERHATNLIAQLHTRKQILLDEVDKTHAAAVKQVNLEKEHCMFQLANMKSLWKFGAKLLEPSQSLQLLAMHDDVTKMVDGIVTSSPPKLPVECMSMQMFVPKETLALGELQQCQLSSALLSKVGQVAANTPNGIGGLQVPAVMSPYHPAPMNLKWHNPRLYWKVGRVGDKKGEINEAYDVAMTANGTVVIAEWLNQRLQIFDSTGTTKDVVGQSLVQPWGVAITHEGNLATTDERDRTVKIFSPKGKCLTSWKKTMFGWPRGIAINRAGQYIVTDTQHGRHTVSIHMSDGQCIRQFGSQGSGSRQFHWPRYVTVDHHDRIIVSDSSNHCVKVFDPTGQFLFKFGSCGGASGQMRHPRGVCVDPNGNILLADQDNDRVTLYSPEGRVIRQVLSLQRPWGISVSEGGLLAVTQKPALNVFRVFDPLP